jgi:hypothetical protein
MCIFLQRKKELDEKLINQKISIAGISYSPLI